MPASLRGATEMYDKLDFKQYRYGKIEFRSDTKCKHSNSVKRHMCAHNKRL